jgi:hypothetical protein
MKSVYFLIALLQLLLISNINSQEITGAPNKVYVNNEEIESYIEIIHDNLTFMAYFNTFISLTQTFILMGYNLIQSDEIFVFHKNEEYIVFDGYDFIKYIYGQKTEYSYGNMEIKNINETIYLSIEYLQFITSGYLRTKDKNIFLFSSDSVLLDNPKNIYECYKKFDEQFSVEIKEKIKNGTGIELYVSLFYYVKIIHEEWLGNGNNILCKWFYENGIYYYYDIANYILIGYYYHLNGIEKTLRELDFEVKDIKTSGYFA